MATLNYCTLKIPKLLFGWIERISETPHFNVYRYKHRKGIIFRIPHNLKADDVCHAFIEHEINLSNTLRTKTLTLKVQVTLVPIDHGMFDGFENLEGDYMCDWEDDNYGYEYFKPDYNSSKNIRRVAPLPPKVINESFAEIFDNIFLQNQHQSDVISKYAVNLGCQAKTLQEFIFVPVPTTSDKIASAKTVELFDQLTKTELVLLPENK